VSVPEILVIEDNLADLHLVRLVLDEQRRPYRLEVLRDGEAALVCIAEHRSGAREPTPCVIVLDLHLPKYNGIQVLTAIRQDPVLSHIHVVVLTSLARTAEKDKVIALGAICREKPSDLEKFFELGAYILNLCGNSTMRFR
jgi:two-component system response regulator